MDNPDKFLIRSVNVLKTFMDKSPSGLDNKVLLDYHRKCHMLYAGNTARPNPNKKFLSDVVRAHDKIVKEMLKRGMHHNTPLPPK